MNKEDILKRVVDKDSKFIIDEMLDCIDLELPYKIIYTLNKERAMEVLKDYKDKSVNPDLKSIKILVGDIYIYPEITVSDDLVVAIINYKELNGSYLSDSYIMLIKEREI